MMPCIGNDLYCPCQDGDACHYRDIPGSPGWLVKEKTMIAPFTESECGELAECLSKPMLDRVLHMQDMLLPFLKTGDDLDGRVLIENDYVHPPWRS